MKGGSYAARRGWDFWGYNPAGDTTPCRMTGVTLHGVVSQEGWAYRRGTVPHRSAHLLLQRLQPRLQRRLPDCRLLQSCSRSCLLLSSLELSDTQVYEP